MAMYHVSKAAKAADRTVEFTRVRRRSTGLCMALFEVPLATCLIMVCIDIN